MYVSFYMHIVLKVWNSSESKALAHSHLIGRQSTLVQRDSFTNLLAQRACVPCMSTNVFLKKCAERSHFRAEFITLLILFYRYFKYLLKSMYFRLRGIFGFLCLHLLSCDASFGLATLASNPCFSILPIRISK